MDFSGSGGFGSGMNMLPPEPLPYEDFQYSFPALSAFESPFSTQQESPHLHTSSWSIPSPHPPSFSLPTSPTSLGFGTGHQLPPTDQGFPGINPTLLQPPPPGSTTTGGAPAPLFSETDHALFSSFLSSLAASSSESNPSNGPIPAGGGMGWEFNPQGMPPDMPVLEELKRRLEMENEGGISEGWVGRGEADEVGREIGDRLRIGPAPSAREEEEARGRSMAGGDGGRKKARTANDDGDVEMSLEVGGSDSAGGSPSTSTNRGRTGRPGGHRSGAAAAKRPSPPGPASVPVTPSTSTFATSAPTTTSSRRTSPPSASPPSASNAGTGSGGKPPHLLSEQKRRSAIQGGFGALVELIRQHETVSGISIGTAETPALPLPGTGKNKKRDAASAGAKGAEVKATGRGRGRRGEVDTGASKSVVLERAVEYVKWMQKGNRALRLEVDRLEGVMVRGGV